MQGNSQAFALLLLGDSQPDGLIDDLQYPADTVHAERVQRVGAAQDVFQGGCCNEA